MWFIGGGLEKIIYFYVLKGLFEQCVKTACLCFFFVGLPGNRFPNTKVLVDFGCLGGSVNLGRPKTGPRRRVQTLGS